MRAKSVSDFIKLLHDHRSFIDALFESSGHQMHIGNAIGMAGTDAIALLEDYAIIETFNNEVLLDDKMASMLESHLIDGYDEDVLDYAKIFKIINDNIELYYRAFENGDDVSRYLRDIQRKLKKIPGNLRDNLISIQRHVDFAYRSASSPAQKVQELTIHNESLREIGERIAYIRIEMTKLKSFIDGTGDASIQFYRNRLGAYLHNAANTVIQMNSTVVEYIKKTNENIRFYKHLSELAELAQHREIIDKTNIYEVVAGSNKWIYHSRFAAVERMNWQIKIDPEFEDGELEQLLSKCNKPIADIGKAEPSTTKIDIYDDSAEEVISVAFLLDSYLLSDNDETLYEYLSSKIDNRDEAQMLEIYLSAVVIGDKQLSFSEESPLLIGGYRCLSAQKSVQGKHYGNY